MSKDYYQETIEKIKLLISNDNLHEANDLITIELKMPYIPNKYESEFLRLKNEVQNSLNANVKKENIAKLLPLDEILNMLNSNDEQQEFIALYELNNFNLLTYKSILKNIIERWDISKNTQKALLFEIMIDQKLDIEIRYNDKLVLNPSKAESIFNNLSIKNTIIEIEQLTKKDPVALQLAISELNRYLFITYPNVIDKPKEFSRNFINVINTMMSKDAKKLNKEEDIIFQLLLK